MNYLQQDNKKSSKNSRNVIAVILVISMTGIFYLLAPKFATQTLYKIAQPIWSAKKYFSLLVEDVIVTVKQKQKLSEENLSLKKTIEEAHASLLTLDSYKRENEELKSLAGRNSSTKKTLAIILQKPNRSLYDSLILDVGLKQGIEVGDIVTSGDFMIGTIVETYDSHSKAELLSSPNRRYDVRIGNSLIDTEAFGQGGGNFVTKLPKEILVSEGDLVKFIGLELKFFGTVEKIEKNEINPFQLILFTLPVNIQMLNWVEVVNKE